jgi:hypothetical protein
MGSRAEVSAGRPEDVRLFSLLYREQERGARESGRLLFGGVGQFGHPFKLCCQGFFLGRTIV